MRGGKLKSFYSAILSRTKGLLLVWVLAAVPLIRAVQMQRPVHTPGVMGQCCCLHPSLLAGLRQAAAVCTLLGQQRQCLAPALFFKDINVSRRIIGLPV